MSRRPKDAKLMYEGEIFKVYQWEQKLFDGSFATFEQIQRPNTALIIPVLPNGKICITKQQQPLSDEFYTVPGGRCDPGENAKVAAKRELLEETGLSPESMELLYSIEPEGKMDWVLTMFIGRNCTKTSKPHIDGGEKIEGMEVDFDEFLDLMLKGRDKSLKLYLYDLIYTNKLEDFKKRLFE